MKVWFVSHYAMPPQYEMREKTQKYASYFASQGHDVKIVTASTIHGTSINLIEDRTPYIEREYNGLKFVHIRCSQYTGNGISRIKNMIEFGRRLQKNFHRFEKPDVIVADVNCINYSSIARICKKNDIKFIVEVRDLWPLSIVEYLHYSPNNPIIRYLYHREKHMYVQADAIVFSMEGGWQYLVEKGWDEVVDMNKVHHINNGVDVDAFAKNQREFIVEDSDLSDSKFFKLVYAGSIRRANNIDLVIDAAKLIDSSKFKFLVWGDGDQLERLQQRVMNEEIYNVVFKGKVEKQFVPSIVSQADATFFILENSPLFRFGLSLNKSFEYLAAGKPLIIVGDAAYSMIDAHNCGYHVRESSAQQFAQAIQQLSSLELSQYEIMCKNAKEAAREYDFKVLANKLIDIVENLS